MGKVYKISDYDLVQSINGINITALADTSGVELGRIRAFSLGLEWPTDEELLKLRAAMLPPENDESQHEAISPAEVRHMNRENTKLLKRLLEQGQRTNQLLEELVKEVKRKK